MYRLLAFFLLAAPAFSTKVQPCEDYPRTLPHVKVADCRETCNVTVGTNVSSAIHLRARNDITSLTARVLNGDDLMWNSTDACTYLKGGCPLKKGESDLLTFFIYAGEGLGGTTVNGHFIMEDQNSNVVACYNLNVTVTKE